MDPLRLRQIVILQLMEWKWLAGGLREAFGIDDPDYYWKNPGKGSD